MIDIILYFFFEVFLFFTTSSQYKIFQAHHYESRKYFKHNIKKKTFYFLLSFSVYVFCLFINNPIKILFVSLLLIIQTSLLFEKGNLKLTSRVKRFLFINFFFSTFLFLIPINKLVLLSTISTFYYIYLICTHLLSCFIENMIMNYYIKDAKRIITNIKVIGITGSYGKTSCKNILYDLLSTSCNVSKTPKSFNNKVGIVKSIRENVQSHDDYFISEYGVDKKGGLDKLLKIVKPNISWITEIGPQHLLTFKSIENIKNEKIKLATILDKFEFAIINNDNNYLKEEIPNLKCNVITYGIKNESCVSAKNIIMNNKGSSFDLYIDNKKCKNIKIKLLGEHNILNVLGAIAVLKCIDFNLSKIDVFAKLIKPIEHRLELTNLQGVKIIDDSFNSNEVGFKKAIDVLSLMKEEKYVITPGIIEQGKNSEIINYELGKYMATKIDFAILVEENANILKKGLLSNSFDEKKIIIKNNFYDAWEFVKSINSNNKIFLIENDLPSIYLK